MSLRLLRVTLVFNTYMGARRVAGCVAAECLSLDAVVLSPIKVMKCN